MKNDGSGVGAGRGGKRQGGEGCKVMYLFSPVRVLYTQQRDPVVVVSYGPDSLLRLLGLDTERIIVPFSSKGVNHMAYLAHVATVVWCATVCLTVVPSFSDITDTSTIGHRFKTDRNPLFHVAQYLRRHYRPTIKSQKTARSVVGVELTTFPTAATDDDKD